MWMASFKLKVFLYDEISNGFDSYLKHLYNKRTLENVKILTEARDVLLNVRRCDSVMQSTFFVCSFT